MFSLDRLEITTVFFQSLFPHHLAHVVFGLAHQSYRSLPVHAAAESFTQTMFDQYKRYKFKQGLPPGLPNTTTPQTIVSFHMAWSGSCLTTFLNMSL